MLSATTVMCKGDTGVMPPHLHPQPQYCTRGPLGVTTDELDANLNFINAVKVITRREQTPVGYTLHGSGVS